MLMAGDTYTYIHINTAVHLSGTQAHNTACPTTELRQRHNSARRLDIRLYQLSVEGWQYSTILYCTVLHCTALHCTVLYCTVL